MAKIFESLDSDDDGYISAQKIDLSNLPNQVLDVLTPLLLKIEEHELNINFEQFTEIVLEFSQNLTVTERNILLGLERESIKNPVSKPSFTPELSANTRAIIELGDERNFKLWEDKRDRGEGRNLNEEQELAHCTFQPKIKEYKPDKFRKLMNSKEEIKSTLAHLISENL